MKVASTRSATRQQGGALREWSFGTRGQSDVADGGAAFREADAARCVLKARVES